MPDRRLTMGRLSAQWFSCIIKQLCTSTHVVDQNIQSPNFHVKTLILRTIITNPDKLASIVLQTLLRSGDLLANELCRISVTPSLS